MSSPTSALKDCCHAHLPEESKPFNPESTWKGRIVHFINETKAGNIIKVLVQTAIFAVVAAVFFTLAFKGSIAAAFSVAAVFSGNIPLALTLAKTASLFIVVALCCLSELERQVEITGTNIATFVKCGFGE